MPVCITGMHRSGTSMVTRLLEGCGLYLGPEQCLMTASPANPEGYMEHVGFVALNEDVIAKLGGAWDIPPTLPEGWLEREEARGFRAKAAALLREFQGREPWGWKDPRNCLTLPLWQHLCAELKVIICLRHPLEVARSLNLIGHYRAYALMKTLRSMYPRLLRSRPAYQHALLAHPLGLMLLKGVNQLQVLFSESSQDYYAHLLGLTLWKIYNESVLDAASPAQRIITHYDAYFSDPQGELRRILDFIGMQCSEERIAQSCALVSKGLRHNRAVADASLPSEVADLYRRMSADGGRFLEDAGLPRA